MPIIQDTVTPELERISRELKRLGRMAIHVGIQGKADSDILMIANVHEYGATIHARNVKNLAIPISKESADKSPRDFDGLFFIETEEGRLYGVTEGRNKGDLNFLFLLMPSVTIPERSFIRGSFDNGQDELQAACRAAIESIVFDGGDAQRAAQIIGGRAVAMVQAYIMAGIDPPKSGITKKLNPPDTPLIGLEGQLHASITYEIDEGNGNE